MATFRKDMDTLQVQTKVDKLALPTYVGGGIHCVGCVAPGFVNFNDVYCF